MHVDARSQRSSESGRRDSRPPCVARGLPLNPRAQSEKASRRITVMRRPGRPANPRVIRRRCSLARPLTPGIDEPETTPWPPLRRRELDGSLHPREVTQPNGRGVPVRSGVAAEIRARQPRSGGYRVDLATGAHKYDATVSTSSRASTARAKAAATPAGTASGAIPIASLDARTTDSIPLEIAG
jgi:hypothetical protein